jgi:hypothetical protein
MTAEASSILPAAFSAGCLRPASAEPHAFEAVSSYVTEEFEGGLTLSKRAESSAAEEASPHYSEPVTSQLAPSGVADATSGISAGAEISTTVVADGPTTVGEETGVSLSNWRQVEEASPASSELPMEDTACSDTEDSGVSDGSGTSSAVGAASIAGTGAGASLPTTHLRRNLDEETMPYAYPKYANHPDAAAHVKQFWSIWAVNHGTQGLTPTKREQSMIVEFQLSLEAQAARWYAQQDVSTFRTFQDLVDKFLEMFQDLVDKFLEMFQVKIDPTEVLKEYYSLQQQSGESVADFLLRFRAVQAMLDTAPMEEIQKRQFLKALRDPLSCRTAPDLRVSWMMTTGVLDEEK